MLRLLLLAAALAACSPSASRSAGPIVGVLEDRPGATTEEPARFVVRAAFYKDGGEWRAYDANRGVSAFPRTMDWTIADRGEALGQVRTQAPASWTLSADAGQMQITGGEPPTRGERSTAFAGWHDTPVYRPLIAISAPNVADPRQWTALRPSASAIASARTAFRAQFADATNCAGDRIPPVRGPYTDAQIETGDGYFSTDGWSIVTLRLGGYRCDGPSNDTPFADQVFSVSRSGETTYLGEGLLFVDAGDYDADGKSDVIFAIDRYNQGGYALYANDFTQHADFTFSYH